MTTGDTTGTELRVALAMRGGVSLAVWIGGAMAELDLARRVMLGDESIPDADQARATAYADLIRSAGYSGLKIDVLAGASAGGLNAVVYGFAQSVGVGLEWLGHVWEEQGDIWSLFHPAWSSPEPFRTEALLRGDGAFYSTLRSELALQAEKVQAEGSTLRPTDYLSVDLAATLQEGPELAGAEDGRDQRPRTAHFRFRRTPAQAGGRFNDMPSSAGGEEEISRLAYAARATSSFPGAFEPATVVSWAPEGDTVARRRAEGDDGPENMVDVFSETSTDSETAFWVMDGGVFDNIPIARALQSIADAPASIPTERVLIYLDPSPPRPAVAARLTPLRLGGSEPPPQRLMRAALIRSTLTALRYKQTVETSTDDLEEIRRLYLAQEGLRTRRYLFLDALPDVLATDPEPLRYRVYRSELQSNRLIELMVHPGRGFLRAMVRPPLLTQVASEVIAPGIRTGLRAVLDERSGTAPLEQDATALMTASELVISWVRQLQDGGPPPALGEALAGAKASAYRVRSAAMLVRDTRESAAVRSTLALSDPTAPTPEIARALWPDVPPDGTASPWLTEPSPYAAEETFWADLEATGADPAELNAMVAAGWAHLCSIVNGTDPTTALDPVLEKLGVDAVTVSGLQDLSLKAVLSVGALMEPAIPRFYAFTGDQAPLTSADGDLLLPAVAREGRAIALDAAMAAHATTMGPGPVTALNAQSKLAGNQLGNFAGFLSATWRVHDWEWGRADAGAALIAMIEDLRSGAPAEPAATGQDDRSPDDPLAEATSQVRVLYARLDRPKHRMSDLSAARRFALGSRALLGAQRALWPVTPADRSAPGRSRAHAPAVVASMVLRPLLVVLPLVLRPPVLAAVLLTAMLAEYARPGAATSLLGTDATSATAVLSGPAASASTTIVVLLLGAVATAYHVWSLSGLVRRWRELEVGGAAADLADIKEAVVARILRRRALIVVATVVLTLLSVAALSWQPSWLVPGKATGYTLVVLLAALVAFSSGRGGLSAVSVSRPSRPPRDVGGIVVLVGTVAGLGAWLAWADRIAGLPERLLLAVPTAAAVGVLVWAVHHAWSDRGWPVGMGLTAAALTLLGGAYLVGPLLRLHQRVADRGHGPAWLALVDLALPLLVVAAVYLVALAAAPLPARWGSVGVGLLLLALLVVTMGAMLVLYVAWSWLHVVPLALVLGTSAAAATTLVSPFREDCPD